MKWRNDLDDGFSYIPRKEVRHDKNREEKLWDVQKTRAKAVSALKRVKRKVNNEINN